MERHGPTKDASRPPIAHALPADLVAGLEDELRVVAVSLLASERPNHTLQPTALVNELWLRMASSNGRGSQARFDSQAAFMAYASKAIRSILIDHARRRGAMKRGGDVEIHSGDCETLVGDSDGPAWDCSFLDLEDEIDLLEKTEKRCAQVFELRFYGGMSPQQVADWLHVPVRSVRDDWDFAQTWLATRLKRRLGARNTTHGNADT